MDNAARIGVVGATGAVGPVTLRILRERGYDRVRAFASARSAGRTVEGITSAVAKMQAGMSRAEVERQIVALNADLPIPMETNRAEHEAHARAVARYLSTPDPGERQRLWSDISRAILVFVPSSPGSREELYERRIRASSDIGVDRIKVRYGTGDKVEEIIYSSNRQLTEVRGACTIHVVVPAPPDTAFPYPCPT